MVFASGEAILHHATSQNDPLEDDAGCPELAVTAMVRGHTNPAILPIEAEFASLQTGTAVLAFEFSDRSFSFTSSYPLLFLLLSTLRN